MDFERAAIKTLFYDYPIETAVECLEKDTEDFLDIFSDISRWRYSSFTISEWKLLGEILHQTWLNCDVPNGCARISKALMLIPMIAEKLLTLDKNHQPRVIFSDLFRWRDVVLEIGEDVLTTAYVAERDVTDETPLNFSRNTFLWSDVLQHDNAHLNDILNKGLSDVHSHYQATADVFHLNWIELVNGRKKDYDLGKITKSQEQHFYSITTTQLYTHKQLCVAATYLRELLYQYLILSQPIPKSDFRLVKNILQDASTMEPILDKIASDIDMLNKSALTSGDNYMFDYAIKSTVSANLNEDNINIIYQGERNLFYQFFVRFKQQQDGIFDIAPYFYLYILIKTHLRREIVETNMLLGFENFAEYQKRKGFAYTTDTKQRVAPRYIAQSTLGANGEQNYLETRIAPNMLQPVIKSEFAKSIFSDVILLPNVPENMSFIVHFLKFEDKSNSDEEMRYESVRKSSKESIEKIINFYENQDNAIDNDLPRLVGIDAAGSELKCRPEAYAQVFRYAKKRGMLGRTYHVGEDFYDLIDGLRAIDEAICFLDLDSNSRIGHALALSVNPCTYYNSRHYKMIISQQALLDNCVWLYCRVAKWNINISPMLNIYLLETAMKMFHNIGYSGIFDIVHYWHSMLLRGDGKDDNVYSSSWKSTVNTPGDAFSNARKDKFAVRWNNEYQYKMKIKRQGSIPCIEKMPEQISPVVLEVQDALIREIAEKHIAIECCPSSNLKIGRFSRYDEHPIFKFRPIDKDTHMPLLNVSINTDDRGAFATSLYNEYSLIALAMMKMKDENGHRKYNDETIYDYIDRIRLNGQQQRFK